MPAKSEWAVAALYKFVTLEAPETWREIVNDACKRHGLRGTILLATEGINGTVAAEPDEMAQFLDWLTEQSPFAGIDIKHSAASEPPFLRLKVRVKREIVTLGAGDLDPASNAGTYVEPKDWNALIADERTVVIDTRNGYETAIGTFEGAIDPETESFGELPAWVDEKLTADPDTPIAMFCTGGIRCEKSTALLKAKGFTNVHHLKGGILRYLEEVPEEESLWHGECFVFDQRVAVKHGLEVGTHTLCHACRMPLSPADRKSESFREGISCPHCHGDNHHRAEERHRQMELARKRGESHLAADVTAARQRKQRLKEEQRARSAGKSAV